MSILEAGAVLLIIGSAVVGPIERDLRHSSDAINLYRQCLYQFPNPGVVTVDNAHCKLLPPNEMEPIEETCERAMREIGAKPELRQNGYEFFVDGSKVRCIPAPSGFRRLP